MDTSDDALSKRETLSAAVEALRSTSRTPARQRHDGALRCVDDVCQLAAEIGLDDSALNAIVDVVSGKSELDQQSITALIRHLFPLEIVSFEATAVVIGALGQGNAKPSPATQVELVKWLINAREVVDLNALSRLYGVLFSLLDISNLRTHLCHLLSLLTRRRHVRPFRIQQILEFSRAVGPDPALVGLLRVYKDYYPDIIVGNSTSGRLSLPRLNRDWRDQLFNLRRSGSNTAKGPSADKPGFRVRRSGRTKPAVLPEVHTIQAKEQSITLEEIEGLNDFVTKLERIELPSQLVAVLADPLLEKLWTVRADGVARARLDLWLTGLLEMLSERTEPGTEERLYLEEVLQNLLRFTRHHIVIPSVLAEFLGRQIPHWNGRSSQDEYLGLMSLLSIDRFEELHRRYFSHVEGQLLSEGDGLEALLDFYTSLATRWCSQLAAITTLNSSSPEIAAMSDLVTHVSALSISAMIASRPSPVADASPVLRFYSVLTAMNETSKGCLPAHFPPPRLVNILLEVHSVSVLSQLCDLFTRHKRLLESQVQASRQFSSPAHHLNQFNTHLMDCCNLLWRSRGLMSDVQPKESTNVVTAIVSGAGCPQNVRTSLQTYVTALDPDYSLATNFDLSHHPLLAGLSRVVIDAIISTRTLATRQVPDGIHRGPVSQRSLMALVEEVGQESTESLGFGFDWREYRISVLWVLEKLGCGGIRRLMFAAMKDLLKGVSGPGGSEDIGELIGF